MDSFTKLSRPAWGANSTSSKPGGESNHNERAHSKFSASGAERWFNCPGSVQLQEGLPDKSSPQALEGTKAHEVLEAVLRGMIAKARVPPVCNDHEMIMHALTAAGFIYKLHLGLPDSEILVEDRIYLDFIHPEMFGTFDGAVLDHFGTLHVFDYKYGAGYVVNPRENLQMIFYAIGLAHKFDWNFKKVRLCIIQPRAKGYDGPVFWELPMMRLKAWVHYFKRAVDKVVNAPPEYKEGAWCYFCKAKGICPIKLSAKAETAKFVFAIPP